MTTPGNDVQTTMDNSPPLGHLSMASDTHHGDDAASDGGPSSYKSYFIGMVGSMSSYRNPFSLHPLGLDSEYSSSK